MHLVQIMGEVSLLVTFKLCSTGAVHLQLFWIYAVQVQIYFSRGAQYADEMNNACTMNYTDRSTAGRLLPPERYTVQLWWMWNAPRHPYFRFQAQKRYASFQNF